MKRYLYKNKLWTLRQLETHRDCKVAGHELRRNIWRKKMSIEDAMVTPIKLTRSRARKKYFWQGLNLTVAELSELPECKVTYYHLHKLLQKGIPLENALAGINKSEVYVFALPDMEIPKIFKDYRPQGSQISFNPPPPPRTDKSYTYEWLVLDRLGFVMTKSGINITDTVDKIVD